MSDYDDDFENYEDDDFEDFDDVASPGPKAPLTYEQELQRAIAKENDVAHRVAVRQTIAETLAEKEARPVGAMTVQAPEAALPVIQLPTKEDLQLDDARSRAGDAARKRIQKLWPLVRGRLREVTVNVPEERSMELKLRGHFVRVEMGTQEDLSQSQQMQTEPMPRVERASKDVQVPDYGQGADDPGLQGVQRRRRQLLDGEELRNAQGRAQSAMFRQAGTVVCKLLEGRKLKLDAGRGGEAVQGALVTSRIRLELPAELRGRRVVGLAVSGGSEARVLAALQPASRPLPLEERIADHSVGGRSALAVWAPSSGEVRERLLCEGCVTCCSWGPDGLDSLVLAGTEEGALYLWDLSAPLPEGDDRYRRPASSTEHGAGFFVHDHGIAALRVLPLERAEQREGGALALGLGSGSSTASRLLAHVAVLDHSGRVSVWDVRENLGMKGLGARVALTLAQPVVPVGRAAGQTGLAAPIETYRASSSTNRAGDAAEEADTGAEEIFEGEVDSSLGLALSVARQGAREYLLVGTSSGRVLKGSRQGAYCSSPWEYEARVEGGEGEDDCAEASAPVAALEACPRDASMFATSSEDGATHVYRTHRRGPVAALFSKSARPALSVFWSRLRPFSLFQVDQGGQLSFWDLTAVADPAPGSTPSVPPLATEDLARASGLPCISAAAVAPRAPGERDLIVVASPEGALACLMIKTPPSAGKFTQLVNPEAGTEEGASEGKRALQHALTRQMTRDDSEGGKVSRINSMVAERGVSGVSELTGFASGAYASDFQDDDDAPQLQTGVASDDY